MKILAKRYEKWGIDVDVEFKTDKKTYFTTMRFDNDKQINDELTAQR